MKTYIYRPTYLVLFICYLLFTLSCSKDEDLFADSISEDISGIQEIRDTFANQNPENAGDHGGTSMTVDSECFDPNYPSIAEFVKAGVIDGIPDNLTVARSIDPSDNLQSAIDETSSNGGGVILLSAGTYRITSTIQLKDNVVLRGVSADQVIMESVIRSEEIFADKVNTFEFLDVTNAGLEHLTILYKVDNVEPIDRDGLTDGGWCWQCFVNDPDGVKNLYVRQVLIDNSSSNCWVSDCNILKSGDDPITIKGDHNTVRNSYIDRAYNKGGGGRAYFHITGDYNLIVNNTVKRLRHFAIERGAEYNVVYQNNIEVDINFHNGDDGNNLIERNIINIPTWHSWDAIVTGDPKFRHSPPGENNIILNNVINNKNENTPYSVPNTIYTLTGFQTVTRTTLPAPQCDTFYPVY